MKIKFYPVNETNTYVMSELETITATEHESKLDNISRKRVRHRKKQLYENILKQMEFYFSDANLTKDRFLGDLVKNDPFVPIAIFLKFNKIRSLTQDPNDIAKAMKNSTVLELSEDKLKVRRKTPVLSYDAEIRTVYVESIPATASREWLQKVFADYGSVAYISLPKFKNSQKIKGFAFIEFTKPEEAQKCINIFTKMGCKLPTCTPPEELSSIKMFSLEENQEDSMNKEEKIDLEPPKKKMKKKEKKGQGQRNSELKVDNDCDNEKRGITPMENDKNIDATTENDKTDAESKDELTSHDESKNDSGPKRKKKARKRSTKERNKAKSILNSKEASKGALWGLQVLSKSEWKALRNKYLNLQRKYMKEMKMSLQNKRHGYSGIPAPAVASAATAPVINTQSDLQNKTAAPLEKISGVFVIETLPEPCLDVRLTKRTIRSNVHALHVDVKEGQTEVIVRFDSPKAADEYCSNSSNRARILSGPEEQEQWNRAEIARNSKRPRGRTRILAKNDAKMATAALNPASPQPTHTHIRFDDE